MGFGPTNSSLEGYESFLTPEMAVFKTQLKKLKEFVLRISIF
jgi:hypothetical protein